MAADTPRRDDDPELQGEGNYTAARRYDQATKRFIDQGKVDPAAQAAQPHSSQEKKEMERAEEVGKSHAKGEDPALRSGGDADDVRDQDRGS
jgi:hypothetical protein